MVVAKEKQITIILQAQVNKNEKYIDKPLKPYMLADSRKLINEPDYILFVMRQTEEGTAFGRNGTLALEKNRLNGGCGNIQYYINKNNIIIEGYEEETYNY